MNFSFEINVINYSCESVTHSFMQTVLIQAATEAAAADDLDVTTWVLLMR